MTTPDLDGDRQRYAPFVPTLEAFARERGLTLSYDSGDHAWGEAHYQLGWVNAHSQMCFLYFNRDSGDEFHLHLLRWGLHSLAGRRDWDIRADEHAAEALRAILEEAVAWADEPTRGSPADGPAA